MSRLLKIFFLFSLFIVHYSPLTSSVHAAEPFPPFSIEGNPPEDYYFDEIFPLFTFIRPPAFQVFENQDYSRNYEALEVCSGENALDSRDYYCNNNGDECEGGDVNVCYKGLNSGKVAYTAHSGKGSCNYHQDKDPNYPDAYREGTCSYKKKPSVSRTVMGTDFSADGTANDSQEFASFVYPKYQDEAARYSNLGDVENPISYGSHHLAFNQCDRATKQLLVVARAKQTKVTVSSTGEWPLGWVDWGYTTENGTTLIQIYNSLPGFIPGFSQIIIEGIDDYYLNSAGIEVMSDISDQKKSFCSEFSSAVVKGEKWATDLSQAPIYSPSFRQGYVRASICVWDLCCPGLRCPLNRDAEEMEGASKALYYDTSISQAFGGALDDILFYYPLKEAAKIFRKVADNNQLIRFLTSSSTQAIPSTIATRLNQDFQGDDCFDSRPNPFRWINFGMIFDYLVNYEHLDEDEKCPGYQLQPELDKQEGGSFASPSLISRFINFIWNKLVDDVDPYKRHLVTVPDAMGQSISELQSYIYSTRDTLSELEKREEYNSSISNTVDDQADRLLAGKYGPIAESQRHLQYFSCDSGEYSAPETSILDYALGIRNSCKGEEKASAGLCDPSLFEALIADSPWKAPLQEATDAVLNSEMFVNGVLNPELEEAYAKASEETGIPCEVIAGIHFEEATAYFTHYGKPEKRAVTNGNKLEPGQTLLDTAIVTGQTVQNPIPSNTSTLITSMSNFNGGGNSNCQQGYMVDGQIVDIPYSGCPRLFLGEDDPYATNMLDSRHTNMWLLFHSDNTPGIPTVYGSGRPGSFAVALVIYNEATSKNSPQKNEEGQEGEGEESTKNSGGGISAFSPKKCGSNSLDTALGCLPYDEDLAITLLTFLIGISGAVSLSVMLAGTIQIMTAAGDIEKSRKGRELFTAAIVGLLFIIFSATLIRTFAGEIIKLPGWL